MRRTPHMAVVVLVLAPLAGCHLIFGYSATDGPVAERADSRPQNDSSKPGQDTSLRDPCSAAPCGAACCVGSCSNGTCTVKLQATADTYVEWFTSTPHGDSIELRVAQSTLPPLLADAYLKFPVDPFKGRQITVAWLHVVAIAGYLPVAVDVGVINVPWEEDVTGVSSQCDGLVYGCLVETTEVQLRPGANALDITARVQELATQAAATGLFIWRPTTGDVRIASREGGAIDRPVLHVTYKR